MNLTETTPRPTLLRRLALVSTAVLLGSTACVSAMALHTSLASSAPVSITPLQPGDPVRVGSGVMAGEILTKVQPKYPQAAKDAKIQGAVLMRAIIGKDGAIENLSVVSGPPELQTSALDAVRQWIYKPYLLHGEPTEVETTITVTYTLAK